MRAKIVFENEKGRLNLPVHYNHIIQSFIYSNLDEKISKFLHDEGYAYQKRRFKLFTFSRLMGKGRFNPEKKEVTFYTPVYFYLSSPVERFIESFVENLLKRQKLKIGREKVFLSSVEVLPNITPQRNVTIRMLSPVTIYSTLLKKDGKKKTYYYNPFENEFSMLIKENLRKKVSLLSGKMDKFEFEIAPVNVKSQDEKIVLYKGTVIKGWMGKYQVKGDPESIKVAYEAGIGAKNSQGFGMFEIIKGG